MPQKIPLSETVVLRLVRFISLTKVYSYIYKGQPSIDSFLFFSEEWYRFFHPSTSCCNKLTLLCCSCIFSSIYRRLDSCNSWSKHRYLHSSHFNSIIRCYLILFYLDQLMQLILVSFNHFKSIYFHLQLNRPNSQLFKLLYLLLEHHIHSRIFSQYHFMPWIVTSLILTQ